jgi:hypothetical protein
MGKNQRCKEIAAGEFSVFAGVLTDSSFFISDKTQNVAAFASVCGSANGKVERRHRDEGTEPKRNARR